MSDNCFFRCLEFNSQYNLISDTDNLLLSVSGGPDSVFLIHYICTSFPNTIKRFIYFDHQTRPKEIVNEIKLLQDVLLSYGQTLIVKKLPLNAYMKRFSVSFEMAARACRYSFLQFYSKLYKTQKVLTAHHFDDDIETLILKVRYYKSDSFYGILPKREFSNSALIRPMLCLSKDDILTYLKEKKYDYCLDLSNTDLKYRRNHIRHVYLPQLRKNDRHFNQKYALILHQSREFHYLKERMLPTISNFIFKSKDGVGGCIYISLDIFYGFPKWVHDDLISRIFSFFITYLQERYSRYFIFEKTIKEAHKSFLKAMLYNYNCKESKMSFVFGSYLILKKGVIGIQLDNDTSKTALNKVDSKQSDIQDLYKKFSIVKKGYDKNMNVKSTSREAFFDAAKISGQIKIRTRQSGDSFIPFGMRNNKKLKHYFIDQKVPKNERDHVPIFFDQDKLIWVYGHQITNSCKITSSTTEILHIKAL